MGEVAARAQLSSAWHLIDADAYAHNGVNNWTNSILQVKPIHGNVRNYLYFDGHVASKRPTATGGY